MTDQQLVALVKRACEIVRAADVGHRISEGPMMAVVLAHLIEVTP